MSGETPAPSSRRDFLRFAGFGTMALGFGVSQALAQQSSPATQTAGVRAQAPGPYNILFILTDQERYFRPGELPAG